MILSTLRHWTKFALLLATCLAAACESVPPSASGAVTSEGETLSLLPGAGVGVYFPPISSSDQPDIRFGPMAGIGPEQRLFFADQINIAASGPERSIPIVVQAVGTERKTLVFMPIGGEATATPYIARAVLARMTSVSRFLPAISEMGLSQDFDIYNMGAVLGFERIIVTDGRDFSHEARLTRN